MAVSQDASSFPEEGLQITKKVDCKCFVISVNWFCNILWTTYCNLSVPNRGLIKKMERDFLLEPVLMGQVVMVLNRKSVGLD